MDYREKLQKQGFKEDEPNKFSRYLNIPQLSLKEVIEIGSRRYLDSYYRIDILRASIGYTEDIDLIESRFRNLQKIFYDCLSE